MFHGNNIQLNKKGCVVMLRPKQYNDAIIFIKLLYSPKLEKLTALIITIC